MTSLSVSQESVETALVSRYSGFTMNVDGVPTSVEVFLEMPSSELENNRVFPSVSIRYLGEINDEESRESDFNSYEEISYDDSVFPNERSDRLVQEPIRIRYSVDTWHKDLASEDQVLYHEMFRRRTPSEGYLSVTNLDGESIDLWVFRIGGIEARNEVDADTVIYHKSVMIEVLAHLSKVEYDELEVSKIVHYANWTVKARNGTMGRDGLLDSIDDSKSVTDLEFTVTESGEELS